MQGSYLKEVSVSFCLRERNLKPLDVAVFLNSLIGKIGLTIVESHLNQLPPGFDIVCTMKESCTYFGYWAEVDFVRMHIISCKDFPIDIIVPFIKENFKTKGEVKVNIIKDCSVFEEVKKIWQTER